MFMIFATRTDYHTGRRECLSASIITTKGGRERGQKEKEREREREAEAERERERERERSNCAAIAAGL